ncbi:MAG TPA: acyl-CoA dehydrogenase family protein [Leptospiraceae bacterium]|nr:acyl-CoA dehydrogenase family protein [Leptospirales bacterium]HMU84535.1 acyl-CoA dehydrogenase family protein [Leptospiraceae bacterium]HMX56247.1 acyl-CoA dehydrogenase family protein [Leptospiraceae bacterium]HNE23022.1 acyl-CoA dehydrogenase family protein [Leptospiraceae bacterium]HNJ35020.1 acyl-CoA dehydrogenase family protein [Leptospiraceae bacterium]
MIQSNYFADNPDLQDHVERFVDWQEMIGLYEDGFRDAQEYKATGNERLSMAPSTNEEALAYYHQMLDAYGDMCGNELSQLAAPMDRIGLKFENGKVTHPAEIEKLFEKFDDAGLRPIAFQKKYGGLGVPNVLKALCQEMSYRADGALSITCGSVNLAAILEAYASKEMRDEWIPKLIHERYSVTMGLSEADFGSDLPSVRTRAEKIDGKWYLTGTKRFQTMACGLNKYPAVLLALARTGAPDSGARGLSFFLVDSKDFEVTGIEKKLGIKASPTCEVAFEKAPGLLIGEEGHGLSRYVIGMLNGARLSVASQGTGIATAAWYEARKYASERIQFGKPIDQIPAVAKMLRRMERESKAMRCLMVEAASAVDRYHWKALRAIDSDEKTKKDDFGRKWEKLASTITPMAKYYISEMANSVAYDAIQVFGGAGFIEEYDVARLYRDARITNIYDGTTQIQVNAAIGGVVSGMAETGGLRAHLQEMLDLVAKGESSRAAILKELFAEFESLVSHFKTLEGAKKDSFAFEVVETATRTLNSLLLAKTSLKLTGTAREERFQLTHEYAVESLGTAQASKLRMTR